MIKYYSDEDGDNIIAVYSEDSHKRIVKKIYNNIGIIFLETIELDIIGVDQVFEDDTVIIPLNNFTEDYLELVDNGISVYVTPNK